MSTHSIMIKSMDSGPRLPWLETLFCYSIWVNALCFSFFICKMGIKAPISQGPLPWIELIYKVHLTY